MRSRILIALLALVGLFLACFVPTADEVYGSGKKSCDPDHPCLGDYECKESVCVKKQPLPPPDSGTGEGVCTQAGLSCSEERWYRCENSQKVLLADCGETGAGCDPARGCLTKCASGCPSGTQCDLATDLCVAVPACAEGTDGGCEGGETCTSGACLTHPAGEAFYVSAGSNTPAAIACFAPPSGDAGTGSGTVMVSGKVRDAWGQPVTATDGQMEATIKVFLASSFDGDANPAPAATITALQQGGAETSFSDFSVPADTALVARVEGPAGSGFVPTYQYFRVAAGSTDSLFLFLYDRKTWDDLLEQAEVPTRSGRALVSGVVRDCATTLSTRGVAAALTTASSGAFYTYPDDHPSCLSGDPMECQANFPLIDLAAKVTGKLGRFFFFDVPATRLDLVLDPGAEGEPVVLPVRTVTDSVLLVNLKPGSF